MTAIDLRASAQSRNEITALRLNRVVPDLMSRHDIDCWVLVSREYAEDPVAQTMLPATWISSRRRTILVFLNTADGHERLAVTRYEVDGLFDSAWDPGRQPDQWMALAEIIRGVDPDRIALSESDDFAHADGLTSTEKEQLCAALGPEQTAKLVSGQSLAVGWLNTRIPEEKPIFTAACSAAHQILRRALSTEAIAPGVTTTADLEWWLRTEVQSLGTTVWFHPSASVQRAGEDLRGSLASATKAHTIEPGDLVHIDFGIVWDHLCTDQQQHGYVLKPGEAAVPEDLDIALHSTNRLQDLLTAEFKPDLTGNEVLAATLISAQKEGLEPRVYTHPIGYHGHGAGPTIGLWDQQGGVPGSGDAELTQPSAWSIELMNRQAIAEWGNEKVDVMLEEDAWFEDGAVEYVDGRQTEIWAI